jgi:hypothetical protein
MKDRTKALLAEMKTWTAHERAKFLALAAAEETNPVSVSVSVMSHGPEVEAAIAVIEALPPECQDALGELLTGEVESIILPDHRELRLTAPGTATA